MSEAEHRLREQLEEARFHNRVLTWLAASLLLALLAVLVWHSS